MRVYLVFICLFLTSVAFSQLLDDSTKQIYGMHSVSYQTENEIITNDTNYKALDSNFYDFHIYNKTFTDLGPRQDLGALGSPSFLMFPRSRNETGVQLGMDYTSFYSFENSDFKYYDTKSPYSELTYFQNFKGQEYFEALFTRSASKNFNFGVQFSRIGANRQIGVNPGDDPFIDTYRASAFTKLKGFNNKYELFANITYYDNEVIESGGVFSESLNNTGDSLFGEFTQVNLLGISSQDRRTNYHLHQSYSIDSLKKLQVFHTYDRQKRRSIYEDTQVGTIRSEIVGGSNAIFYPRVLNDTLNYDDSTFFTTHTNDLGLKGTLSNLFYMAFISHRSINYKRLKDSLRVTLFNGNELYVGGMVKQSFSSGSALVLEGKGSKDGYVSSTNSFTSNRIKANITFLSKPASLLEKSLYNNHFAWTNNFTNQQDLEFRVEYKAQFNDLKLKIGGSFLINNDLIYYDQSAAPMQYNGSINTINTSVKGVYEQGKFRFSNELFISTTSNNDIVRIPLLFNHFQIAYKTTPKNSHYKVLIGTDIWSRSSYYGNAYMPYIQQFYLQDDFLLSSYTWADLFISLDIKNALIFIKMPHVTQNIIKKGYFVTPYYYGAQRVLEIGFNWKFFD